MRIIGDIHGVWDLYLEIRQGASSSIQIGDLGIFNYNDLDKIPIDNNHRFFRANHDNPEVFALHPNALPDFGFENDIFWYAGAYSIDYGRRTLGIDYWYNEELGQADFQKAAEIYAFNKPNVVLSHDCPLFVYKYLNTNPARPSYTSRALEELFNIHMPEIWIFGHHHRKLDVLHKERTRFIGLSCLVPGWRFDTKNVYVDI